MITAETVIQSLESYIYKELIATHPEKTALACTKALFECLYINFRTQLMYVPTRDKAQINDLYESIYAEFNGRNYMELSIKHKRSLPNIYNIVNSCKNKQVRKRQNDLFPLPIEEDTKPLTLRVIEEYLPIEFIKAGLMDQEAKIISQKIARYLCQNFPGISICISDTMRKKRTQKGQQCLF